MAITRRTVIAGLAALPATGAAAAEQWVRLPTFVEGVPAEVLDAYRRSRAAEERFEHHLLNAALALDDIIGPAEGRRWQIVAGGTPGGYDVWCQVGRFDKVLDFSLPACPSGICVERTTPIYYRHKGKADWRYREA